MQEEEKESILYMVFRTPRCPLAIFLASRDTLKISQNPKKDEVKVVVEVFI